MTRSDLDRLSNGSESFTTFGGAIKDFSAGLGLSVVKAVEGVFELGNIVPGVDYDLGLVEEVKDIFDYEESDSFAEQAGETIGFLGSLFTGAGAVGKAASLTGKLAKSSKALRGYNRTRAAQATTALIKKHPKTAAFLREESKYAMADFLMTSGDDAFDVVSALGLDDAAIVEHFAMEEGDSELSRRLKGALQGFAIGVPFEFALIGGARAFEAGKEALGKGVEIKKVDPVDRVDAPASASPDPVDRVDAPADPDAGPVLPPDPDAPGGPTMFFDAKPKAATDLGKLDAHREAQVLREIAEELDAIAEATGKGGRIVDRSFSLRNVSPTTKEAATQLGSTIKAKINTTQEALREGRIAADRVSEAKEQLIELRRMQKELDQKVPGLFRGTTPIEHLDVFDRPGGVGNKYIGYVKRAILGDDPIEFDDVVLVIGDVVRGAAPSDRLTVVELSAFGSKAKIKDPVDRAVQRGLIGKEMDDSLTKFAKETAEAMDVDEDRVYSFYSEYLFSLKKEFDRNIKKGVDASITEDKQQLILTQIADEIATLKEAFDGIVRPNALHKRRGLASMSTAEIVKRSPDAVKRELARIGSDRRYDFSVLRRMQKALKEGGVGFSSLESLNELQAGKFSGWTHKAAELNVAMIMAGTKLLGSNLIQNWMKGKIDALSEKFSKFFLRKGKFAGKDVVRENLPVINPITLHKTKSSISLWGKFVKASYKGQRSGGTGSLLASVDASREVRPTVSAFKDPSVTREMGFLGAAAADDGTKAMVLLDDTLTALSKRDDLTKQEFDIIQNNLPDIIAQRLEIGTAIRKEQLATDVSVLIRDAKIGGENPVVQENFATLQSEVEDILHDAFERSKDRTFTEFRSEDRIRRENGAVHAAIANVTRKIATGTETIPVFGPLIRNLTMPFVNTPINAVLYGSSFTPLSRSWRTGFAAQLKNMGVDLPGVKKLFEEFDPNNAEHIRALGNFWVGNTIMGSTLVLAHSGLIDVTGRGPDEPAARKEWLKAGNQPYSITLGTTGKVIGLKRLGPMAAPFMVAAELKELFAENPWSEEALSDDIAGAMAALGESVMGMSALDSSAKLLDAIVNQDESAINQIVANLAVPVVGASMTAVANVLPVASSAGATASQFFQREDRVPGQTMVDSIKNSIQNRYLRFTADTRRNAYGEALDVNKYDALTASILPILEVTTKEMDKVDKELASLNYPVSKVRHIMSGLNLTEAKYAIGNQSAYDRYQELLGTTRVGGRTLTQELDRLIRSSKYRKLQDEGIEELNLESPKVLEIRKTFATYRAAAKEELMKENALLKGDLRRVEAAKLSLQTGRSPETIISQLFEI